MANYGLKSEWYRRSDMGRFKKLLKEGDLLEFNRGVYKHWAIYINFYKKGVANVIHRSASSTVDDFFVGSQSLSKRSHGIGTIDIEPLEDVLGEYLVRINNSLDEQYNTASSDRIVQIALYYMKNEDEIGEYDVVQNNCEHFVTLCRYDQKRSMQVVKTAAIAGGVIGGAILVGVGIKLLSSLFQGNNNDEEDDEDSKNSSKKKVHVLYK